MKGIIAACSLVAAVSAATIGPVLMQPQVGAKRSSAASMQARAQKNAQIAEAMAALRKGDPIQVASARKVISQVPKSDHRNMEFARLLAERGEKKAAFELARGHVHFNELNVPDEKAMAFYANLAGSLGHADEAAWARQRMGAEGRYHVWKVGTLRLFSTAHASLRRAGMYNSEVNNTMDDALRLYPDLRPEIEALRKKLLVATQAEIASMYEAVATPATSTARKGNR